MASSMSPVTIRREVEVAGAGGEPRPLLQLIGHGTEALNANSDFHAISGWTSSVAHRPSFAHTEIKLGSGEHKVVASGGAMLWMDGKMHMDTSCHGGCASALCRTCSQEKCCMNTFSGPGHVSFGFELPGDILPFGVSDKEGWMMTPRSFICGTPNVDISAKWFGCLPGLCGGEGFFMTHVRAMSGTGIFYAGNYGQIQRHEVQAGKVFVVHSGLFFAASDQTQVDVGLPGGCGELLCSGEGVVLKFRGPCVIYTQNRSRAAIEKILYPYKYVDPEKVKAVLKIILEILAKQ